MAGNTSDSCPIDTCSFVHAAHEGPMDLLDTNELSLPESTSNLGFLPDPHHRTRDEVVLQLNSNTEWQLRRMVLEKDKLMIANPGQNAVIDQIPLVCNFGWRKTLFC
jgi:hypothetical protein